jgi:hypothetical protein
MNANCPSCAASVTYYASDIGANMNCRTCGALLKVSANGLSQVSGGAVRPANPGGTVSTAPHPTSPPSETPPVFAKALVYLDWLGWAMGFLYVPGLFFTLLFLLFPQMDEASVARMKLSYQDDNAPHRKKEIEYQQNLFKKGDDFRNKQRQIKYREDDLNERFNELNKRERALPNDAKADERKAINDQRDGLNKEMTALVKERDNTNADAASALYRNQKDMRSDKEKLDKEKEDWQFKKLYLMVDQTQSETSAASRRWWYLWGLLFGTIMLMLGGIGYLSPRQGTWRRVVGAITVAAIVLMIAAKMNGGRSVIFGASAVIKDREVQTQTLPTYAQVRTTNSRQVRPKNSTCRLQVSDC